MREIESENADRLAARAVGAGAGLITLMLTWTLGSRVAELVWPRSTAAVAAIICAIGFGLIVAVLTGLRLTRRDRR